MSDLEKAIFRLVSSSHYQQLATYKPPFDLFEVMGIPDRELSHTKVLIWLLSDESNREFRQKYVSWIVKNLGNDNLAVGVNEPVDITYEHSDQEGRMDVFAHFPRLELAVVIEVKIRTGEGDTQIGRYQRFLNRKYPCYDRKAVIFLTRSGDSPKTGDPKTCVRVLNMSWDEVARIIDNMQPEQGEENDFRIQFRNHLDRRIVMNETEEQRIVKDLLNEGDNAETIKRIIDNLPSLKDFSDQWEKIVVEVCRADSLEIETYSQRGSVKELQITVTEWREAGLPFTLILYEYQTAGVRILLHKDALTECRQELEKFARSSNGIVNDEFPLADKWVGWRAVLAADGSEEEPPGTVIGAGIFYHDEQWKEQVKEKLESQMKKLREPINNWLNNNNLENT